MIKISPKGEPFIDRNDLCVPDDFILSMYATTSQICEPNFGEPTPVEFVCYGQDDEEVCCDTEWKEWVEIKLTILPSSKVCEI